jgi:hypothetical protein
MRLFAALVTGSLLLASPTTHERHTSARVFNDPFGPAKAIVSPNGRLALWGQYSSSQLWMENTSSGKNRLVGPFTVQTISLAWSPDSRHFVVNDRETSTESNAYLFETDTLQRGDLSNILTAKFPEAMHCLVSNRPGPERGRVSHKRDVMHSYVDVRRWIDDQHVELQLHGNFAGRFRDDNPDGYLYSAGCFDLRFRMGLDGSVKKLSQRMTESLSKDSACGGPEQ